MNGLMKTSLVALVAAGLAACSSAVPGSRDAENSQQEVEAAEARAPEAPADDAEPGRRRGPPSPERLLKRLDKDGNGLVERGEIPKFLESADANNDGRLTVEELRAHHEKMRAAHFARKDANGDGVLTQDEVGERHWSKLSVADADQDGKLTRAELDAAHASGKLHKRHKGMGRHKGMRPARLIEKLDQNQNGVLELTELPERKRERLTGADTNGDQRLSMEELEAFFQMHRGHRGKHFRGPPPGAPPTP
jgi:Ca2+-binding EF-hand superfamily protein